MSLGGWVAAGADRAYLMGGAAPMPDTALEQTRFSWPIIAVAAGCGALIAATLALWVHYGTAVFFEIIAAGIAACF